MSEPYLPLFSTSAMEEWFSIKPNRALVPSDWICPCSKGRFQCYRLRVVQGSADGIPVIDNTLNLTDVIDRNFLENWKIEGFARPRHVIFSDQSC